MASGYATTNFPNGITSWGMPVFGSSNLPLPASNGNYWFVSSLLGNNGNPGTFSSPFATLAFAAGYANLLPGDVIILMEGHTENVSAAAGILLSTAAVQVIGMGGMGPNQPIIYFTGSVAATTLKITGASVSISGIKFVPQIITNNQVTCLDIQAKGVLIQNNRFLIPSTASTAVCLSFIDFVNATANVADHTQIIGNQFVNELSAGQLNHAVGLTTVQNDVAISNNYIYGYFALSGIHNITGKVMTNLTINGNYVKNLTAATVAMNIISASTGVAYRNIFEPGDATVASAIFGTAIDASGQNIGIRGNLDAGQEFWYIKKGVVSSTITTAGVAICTASIGGELAIKNVILKTDPTTGLAGLATLKITTNNVNGNPIVMSTTNVGAAVTSSMVPENTGSSATSAATVLESGKIIYATALTTAGTGAGTVDIYVLLQRLTAGANVSAA